MSNLATDYADGIVRTLESVERLTDTDCTDPDALAELDSGDIDTLEELFEVNPPAGRNRLEEIAQGARDWLDNRGTDAAGAWLDGALDIELHGRRGLHDTEWNLTKTRVVVTIGGPNAYVIDWGDGIDHLYVEVHWGGDQARRGVYAPSVSQRITETLEGLMLA